jgi:hypothetical protein
MLASLIKGFKKSSNLRLLPSIPPPEMQQQVPSWKQRAALTRTCQNFDLGLPNLQN